MDRVPITTLSGLLTGHVGLDHLVLPAGQIGGVLTFFAAVTDAPSGGSVVVDLRTATGGGGSGLTATITTGTKTDEATGELTLTGTEALYLRVVSEAGSAMNLSGWFELSTTTSSVAVLTNLTRVKAHADIDESTYDALLSDLINGVSVAMQRNMDREIVSTATTAELVSASVGDDRLWLHESPILASPAPVVRHEGEVVPSTDYTILADQGALLAMEDDVAGKWAAGSWAYSVDYSAGYTSVPEDLVLAATKQVRHEFHQASEGNDRLGSLSKSLETGGSSTWVPGGWLPEVLEVMDSYRRMS